MNKQMEDLMYHAGLTAQGCWDEMDGYDKQAIEKFAKLIVKECLTFCEYRGDRFDEYDSGMTERARIIRESIQEHFGVEE